MPAPDLRFLPEFKKYDLRSRTDPGYWYRADMGLQKLERIRFPWFVGQLPALAGLRVLDIGCGGGILSEDLARSGAHVTALDPSRETLKLARAHAKREGLVIDYRHGFAEDIKDRKAFDIVFAVDVLEHVNDLPRTLDKALHALKPGGWFGYLTHNATLEAFKEIIWKWEYETPARSRGHHDFHRFIRPDDLARHLRTRGARVEAQTGIRWSPKLALAKSLAVTYMGLARLSEKKRPSVR